MPLLKSEFELTWKNIKNTDFVGYSRGYHAKRCAVGTTNGAGPHNVQIFVLTPDTVVLHALPGFWHPEDLARELHLALSLFKLWKSESYSAAQKSRMFRRIQMNAVRAQPAETFARSTWQGFDVSTERARDQRGDRDTFFDEKARAVPGNLQRLLQECTTLPVQPGQKIIKPINLIVHERMADRPFVPFARFDTKAFVDYGKMQYDLNDRRDGSRDGSRGKKFAGQDRLRHQRAVATKKARHTR